jgi:hypothetical protein
MWLALPKLQLLMCTRQQAPGHLLIILQRPHPLFWQQALAAAHRRFSRLLKGCHCRRQGAVPNLRAAGRETEGIDSSNGSPIIAVLLLSQLNGLKVELHSLLCLLPVAANLQGLCCCNVALGVAGLQLAHCLGAAGSDCFHCRQLFCRGLGHPTCQAKCKAPAAVLQLLDCRQLLLAALAGGQLLQLALQQAAARWRSQLFSHCLVPQHGLHVSACCPCRYVPPQHQFKLCCVGFRCSHWQAAHVH